MDQRISVMPDTYTIVVDGEAIQVPPAKWPKLSSDIRVMNWFPHHTFPAGIEYRSGELRRGDDASSFKPFLKLHKSLKAEAVKNAARAQKAADAAEVVRVAAEKQALADQKAAEEERADREHLDTALVALANSDHEVIKAMEAMLSAAGKIDGALVADRAGWRKVARTEKKRLDKKAARAAKRKKT